MMAFVLVVSMVMVVLVDFLLMMFWLIFLLLMLQYQRVQASVPRPCSLMLVILHLWHGFYLRQEQLDFLDVAMFPQAHVGIGSCFH